MSIELDEHEADEKGLSVERTRTSVGISLFAELILFFGCLLALEYGYSYEFPVWIHQNCFQRTPLLLAPKNQHCVHNHKSVIFVVKWFFR